MAPPFFQNRTSRGCSRPAAAARRFVVVVIVLTVLHGTFAANAETWTSLRGTHSVEARMVGLWDGTVVLELADGRRVSVKLNDLRSESRIQAQELSKGIASSRGERVRELQGQAAAAAAPAPDPLPKPPAAPAYKPPVKDATAAEFLQQVDAAIQDGHVLAIYDALPASYQKDVSDVVKLAAQSTDPQTWKAVVGTAQKLGDLIVTRQRWFFSSPRVKALPPDQLASVEDQVLTFAGLLRDGLDPQALQLETLQSTDFRQWLVERDAAIAPQLARLFQHVDTGGARQFSIASEKGGVTVVTVEGGGSRSNISVVKVEGCWVPKSIADGWADSIAAWKESLASGSVLESPAMMLGAIAPALEPMSNAGDAGQFHAAMEAMFMPAETLVTTLTTLMGKNMNLASRGGGYDEDMGYDEEMYDEEMYEEDMDSIDAEMEEEMMDGPP